MVDRYVLSELRYEEQCRAKLLPELRLEAGYNRRSRSGPAAVSRWTPRSSVAGRTLERSGFRSLSLAGVIGLILFVFWPPSIQIWGTISDLYSLDRSSRGSFSLYSPRGLSFLRKGLFEAAGRSRSEKDQATDVATGKLIEDRPFEPAPSSVTEDTTEFLKVPVAQDKD